MYTTATSITPDVEAVKKIFVTALASNLTIQNPLGNGFYGQTLLIRIK